MKRETNPYPVFELRCGGVKLTVQRVSPWLLTLLTTVGGAVGTWWAQR
ncbi:hypothetical protein [Kitasatospora sp. NPDC059673]